MQLLHILIVIINCVIYCFPHDCVNYVDVS